MNNTQAIPTRVRVHSTAAAAIALLALPGGLHAYAQQVTPPHEAMTDLKLLPMQQSYVVAPGTNWANNTGFGANTPMITMMNLMMVGGSGMEGMKMAAMKPGTSMPDAAGVSGMAAMNGAGSPPAAGFALLPSITPNPPVVGDNRLEVDVTDRAGKPATGLKVKTAVAMTSMDMGTANPEMKEVKPGHYLATVNFAMKGPWAVTLDAPQPGAKPATSIHVVYNFDVGGKQKWSPPAGLTVKLDTPANGLKVGDNTLQFTILDSSGKPVTGARVNATVEMTSMDMGSSHPAVRGDANGRYTVPVKLAMQGPWRITLNVQQKGAAPMTKAFDVNAK